VLFRSRGTPADKLPIIAFTSAKRDPDHPDIPTVKEETGLDFTVDVWWGLFAPAGLPAAIRDRMNREITAICADKEFIDFLKTYSANASSSTPDELREDVARDVKRWTEVARRAGLQKE
jgi:tripartite-type tricarboxylate transporter receptor subunit TctC